MTSEPVKLNITRLGAQGDGIARHEGREVFVPLCLPGESVMARLSGDRAEVIEWLTAAADRAEARCSHYGDCGGCSLQHLSEAAYEAFKRASVTTALSYAGITAQLQPTLTVAPGSRRRAVFAARRAQGRVWLGFHGRRSHRIVPIDDCAVIRPALRALLPGLRQIAELAAPAREPLSLTACETLTGVDLALAGAPRDLNADQRARLIEAAAGIGLTRLSVNGEIAMQRTAPLLPMGAARVTPPPGGFLQASAEAEAAMTGLVCKTLAGSKAVVDLFAGAGTFCLPLASFAKVHAVESETGGLAAIDSAARRTQGLRPVTTEKRDLFRQPLSRQELRRFDAAVIDPPRAGAEGQTREIAASDLRRVAMISCNAQTFARDLRIMLDAGYRLETLTPVDQFLWSPHIEIVAALGR